MLQFLGQCADLCAQWEDWADQLFEALRGGDLNALTTVTAQQANLAACFGQLEVQRRRLQEVGPRRGADGVQADPPATSSRLRTELRARRWTLQAAANRVLAANCRNLKALRVLQALGGACEAQMVPAQACLYSRPGGPAKPRQAIHAIIDRRG